MKTSNLKLGSLGRLGFGINREEWLWNTLVDQIIDGNVIPVIGPDILVDGPVNMHQQIIDLIADELQMEPHPTSFSELVYSDEFQRLGKDSAEQIYLLVNQIIADGEISNCKPSERLKELLSIKQFLFIITTSFTPVVEEAMREIWGNELKVLRFNNNPQEIKDITSGTDLRKPTLYYMFGKVGDGDHRYVLTDIDMLDFVSSWLSSDRRPRNLCSELKNKYLLMLGTDYANWLFRFIWYSLRHDNSKRGVQRQMDLGQSMLAYENNLDNSLIDFLERAQTFTKQDTSKVIGEIIRRLDIKFQEHECEKFDMPEENMDVFISYSRADSDIAEKLYKELTAQGKLVWYDKRNLTEGGNFMDEIKKAIHTAKYFVPILSQNVMKEKKEPHVYRIEWEHAITTSISMGRTFIIPVAEQGFDFYNAAIPERMQRHNAVFFERTDISIKQMAEKIIHKMNET